MQDPGKGWEAVRRGVDRKKIHELWSSNSSNNSQERPSPSGADPVHNRFLEVESQMVTVDGRSESDRLGDCNQRVLSSVDSITNP